MREKIKCLDGPLEGTEVQLDRRLYRLYDFHEIEDEEGVKYRYQMSTQGLRYAPLG